MRGFCQTMSLWAHNTCSLWPSEWEECNGWGSGLFYLFFDWQAQICTFRHTLFSISLDHWCVPEILSVIPSMHSFLSTSTTPNASMIMIFPSSLFMGVSKLIHSQVKKKKDKYRPTSSASQWEGMYCMKPCLLCAK